jgi:hypothetical protein
MAEKVEYSMEYHLYPPHFIIEPQSSFSEAWEDFCRYLLNLANRTSDIRRRTAPEFGADLLWDAESILYQCKTSRDGQAGSLDMGEVKKSIDRAVENQKMLRWSKYVLCTNVDLTGKQERDLRTYLPGIEFLSRGYWADLCKKFYPEVADRFRVLIPVSSNNVLRAINEAYLRDYEQQFQTPTSFPSFSLLVYSNRYKDMLDLQVSPDFSVDDILLILRTLFKLPDPIEYKDIERSVSIDYALYIDNKEVPSHKILRELRLDERPIVTVWRVEVFFKKAVLEYQKRFLEGNRQIAKWIKAQGQPIDALSQTAIERYEQKLEKVFTTAIELLKDCLK